MDGGNSIQTLEGKKAIKKIILLPIYNENSTLLGILEKLKPVADVIIMVNDGSTDNSGKIAAEWAGENSNSIFINLEKNMGKSHALKLSFEKIMEIEGMGEACEDDLVIIMDADGQLPPDIIKPACETFQNRQLCMLIGSRDFSHYPVIKKIGNLILSFLARIFTGYYFKDTQCGFRIFSIKVLKEILPFYHARGYSCEQELSIIAALLGMKLDNSFTIIPEYYRSNSTYTDAFYIALDSFFTWQRVRKFRKKEDS